jgi:hypothetical protein
VDKGGFRNERSCYFAVFTGTGKAAIARFAAYF